MDMATELRSRMAAKQITVADVATAVGRTPVQISRYRNGQTPIPLGVAQELCRMGLLAEGTLLGRGGEAA